MKKLFAYAAAALLLVALSAPIAGARGHGGHGGGLGSTASQYTGTGYWPSMGQSNSSLGGPPNAMTQPVAPWLADENIPPRWRATEMPRPDPPAPSQPEARPPIPGGDVEMSGGTPPR